MSPESDANRLAAASLAAGDATGWFDRLYREAADGSATVPWDRGEPNPLLTAWATGRELSGTAVVVGAGLGRDAEFLAARGVGVTAFDISPTAVARAAELHPGTAVTYVAADLLDPPTAWLGSFDLVLESFTVQAVPVPLHVRFTDAVVSLVAPGGTLLAIGGIGVEGESVDGPPWPLTPREIDRFSAGPLVEVAREEIDWRWRVELVRPLAVRVWVSGHVQGVGFRAWTRRRALALGLTGAAVNRPDGRVEVHAEGSHEAIEQLVAALRGPGTPGAVNGVEAEAAPALGLTRFRTG